MMRSPVNTLLQTDRWFYQMQIKLLMGNKRAGKPRPYDDSCDLNYLFFQEGEL